MPATSPLVTAYVALPLYREMAQELTYELEARQEAPTIVAVRCPNCSEMLDVAHAEGHACWLLEGK